MSNHSPRADPPLSRVTQTPLCEIKDGLGAVVEEDGEGEYEYEHYPTLLTLCNYACRACGVCGSRWASRVVYGDRLCAENPAYMCGQCYHMLHYSCNGGAGAEPELLYNDFKVFPYVHDMDEKPFEQDRREGMSALIRSSD